jgi:lysophospholipase L1-like esterase
MRFCSDSNLLKNVIFTIITICLVLAVFEGALRLYGIRAGDRVVPFQPDVRFGWIYQPHYEGNWHGAEVSINSLGIRNRELTREKGEGTYRILCLGDSVTFGYGTESDKTYVKVLESILREGHPDRRFETINAGIGGFTTLQELLFLKTIGLEFEPDLVTVGFVLNDVTDMSTVEKRIERARKMEDKRKPSGLNQAAVGIPNLRHTIYSLVSRTSIYILFTRFMGDFKKWQEARGVKQLVAAPNPTPEIERYWQKIEADLREITILAGQEEFEVLLVTLPFRFQIEEDDPLRIPQDRLIDFCGGIGLPVLDLLPRFRERRGDGLFLDTNHPTVTGHRLVAESIYEHLVEERLVPL